MSNTHEKIIEAAKELFSTKGYAATTTKDIASHAGVSEVTLFRHFESKRNLFHATIHGAMESGILINFFENELEYNLEKDLTKFSKYLFALYKDNGPLIKILMKDKDTNYDEKLSHPKVEKKVLKYGINYFDKMYELGQISDDPILCQKFFFHNAIGFLMRKFVLEKCDDGTEYYEWMINKTINAIKIDKK